MKRHTMLLTIILAMLLSCSKSAQDDPNPNPPPVNPPPEPPPPANKTVKLPINGGKINIRDASKVDYKPGDTLLITESVKSITLYQVKGEENKPVVITAAPGVVIGGDANKSADFVLKYVKLKGLTIKGNSASIGVRVYFSTDVTLEDINVDSASVGVMIKNDAWATDSSTFYPHGVIRNIHLKNVHVKNTHTEGYYIGNTSMYKDNCINSPIVGLTVTDCSAENTGWDGFQVTNAQDCKINGLTVKNAALLKQPNQMSGIALQDATTGTFENLSVETCNGAGLTIFSCGEPVIKNVVIKDAGLASGASAIFIDNRSDFGFNLGAKKLWMENVEIKGGTLLGKYPVHIMNGSLRGALPAVPGTIKNLTYDKGLWLSRIFDAVPNNYVGGTEGGRKKK
ncbi:right-handed parallel beta-helix repeat-containing protein [Foetidibacter luteolus]|uniref:right-handed parallel beta-helix repeat-containing protein n=1 Tax=Foetidibacter luteolus TaxID=2608880 RepID=UPI00129B0200|nr:right-handed parallel beta-helix repeat-containing protein [Foetidibacter luteolus]